MKLYRVLICGDRNWKKSYAKIVKREIKRLVKEHGTKTLLIIEGGAPGVDSLAKLAAHNENVHVAEIEALWKTRHQAAGPQRNKIMAALKPHEIIAIHDNIEESTGTKGMTEIAVKQGIPWRLVES